MFSSVKSVWQRFRSESGETQTAVPGKEGGLGTFGGVFTPSILTILGVIMYLRYGWVVGNVGLFGAFLVVTLSTGITLLTAFSISAIATDQRVRIGGAYYMISRSLGLETGGAVGIPLFFALALSVALYTVGFAESVVNVFPSLNQRVVGLITTVGVAGLAIVSAKAAIRSQYVIMAAIAVSLISLYFGSPIEQSDIEMWGAREGLSEPFWVVFAVFFPAVTGIMAGVNLSGDLEDPGKSIPWGTFAAIGVGYLIYMTLPIVLATRADAATLIEDPLVMRRISFWGDAILLGVWGATLSSAVGSILGAPRVLQALARDGVLPRWLRWLGHGSGEEDTPRYGTVLTMVIALTAVALGDLNAIAPVLTMFFLATYCVLNVAAGIETALNSPSFRPTFKVSWILSLLGAIGCLSVMFLINATATVIAIACILGIFAWLKRKGMKSAWGDVRQGLWMAAVRSGLLRHQNNPDPKNWRPHLLVLTGAPTSRWHLVELASSWTHDRALMTVATVFPEEEFSNERQQKMETNIREHLAERGVQTLVRSVSASNPFDGGEHLVEAYGLGRLTPNTVVLGDTENPDHAERYCTMIRNFYQAQRNVLIVQQDDDTDFNQRERIDVWWGGLEGNGGLMKVMAYLLNTSFLWKDAQVVLKMVAPDEEAAEQMYQNVDPIVKRIRIGAKLDVIIGNGRAFDDILHESSQDADLIFLGMAAPDEVDDFTSYYKELHNRTRDLPATIYTLAAEPVAFREVLSD